MEMRGLVRSARFAKFAAPLVLAVGAFSILGFTAPADADGTNIVGYDASAQALGAQFAFGVSNLIPIPGNILEEDAPIAQTTVSSGPLVDALAAPYYPGNILANFGGIISEFGPPGSPNIPFDPASARAQYPKSTQFPTDATFGGTPPAGSPLAPNVFAATAHAGQDGGSSQGTVVGFGAGTPGAAPAIQVANVQTTTDVSIGSASLSASAGTVMHGITVAGVLDIGVLNAQASATSDGTNAVPKAAVHLGDVTVQGQSAYIDSTGVHVSGNSAPDAGVSPKMAQATLDQTFAQDGMTIRLIDPTTITNDTEGVADSGALVITVQHKLFIPYFPLGKLTGGQVTGCLPTGQQVLGNVCPPAGLYTETTTVLLGESSVDANADTVPSLSATTGSFGPLGGLGAESGSGLFPPNSEAPSGEGLGLGAQNAAVGPTGTAPLGSLRLLQFPLHGIPAPLGWIITAVILCVIFAYPMLLTARWQFLTKRRR